MCEKCPVLGTPVWKWQGCLLEDKIKNTLLTTTTTNFVNKQIIIITEALSTASKAIRGGTMHAKYEIKTEAN